MRGEDCVFPDDAAADRPLFLLRFSGDLSTKAAGTKRLFARRLARNLEDALTSAGLDYRLRVGRYRFYLEVESVGAADLLTRIFGLQSFSVVHRVPWRTLDDLVVAGERGFREAVRGRRFAVRAHRSGNLSLIPFRSADVERDLGRRLLAVAAGVHLDDPEITAHVEVQPGQAFFYDRKIPGPGGLPLGVEGRALSLVSGGFDSAVASWLLCKRGVRLDYLFLNLGGSAHRAGVLRVLDVLARHWSYGTRPRLYEMDFAPVVATIRERVEGRYWQLVLKRLMLEAAAALAARLNVKAVVTGDALGQVSSQTLQNLAVLSPPGDRPLLRPLLGFDKQEIIALARRIGTYPHSAEVDEYCAILPRHPATHASREAVEAQLTRIEPERRAAWFAYASSTDLRSAPKPAAPATPELEEIPSDAVVLDLRSRAAYTAWHVPGALHLDFTAALATYRSLDRSRSYAVYCEVGQKSAHLAELMREAGFRAAPVRGGVERLLKQVPAPDLLGL
jgi:thiamine biosynthesis protein ThiI